MRLTAGSEHSYVQEALWRTQKGTTVERFDILMHALCIETTDQDAVQEEIKGEILETSFQEVIDTSGMDEITSRLNTVLELN